MGGCASKSKVLKGADAVETPTAAADVVSAVSEVEEVKTKEVEGGGGEDYTDKEIVDDEQATKRGSLNLLFKQVHDPSFYWFKLMLMFDFLCKCFLFSVVGN